jgi:hypothetical protein
MSNSNFQLKTGLLFEPGNFNTLGLLFSLLVIGSPAYSADLTPGDDCLMLTIEDGGGSVHFHELMFILLLLVLRPGRRGSKFIWVSK